MENATKALLIAGSMLLAVMLISLLVMGYNRISSHYEQQHELLTAEQLDKFNKQFQNYKRSDIRGNELISLMNKVIDYNTSQSYQEGTGYEPIKVEIDMISDDIINQFFKYNTADESIISVDADCKITNTVTPTYSSDKKLVAITNTSADLRLKAAEAYITNLTDTQLQKLTAEISNIIIDEEIDGINQDGTNWSEQQKYRAGENRRNRAILLKNILNLRVTTNLSETIYDIKLDKDNYYKTIEGQDKIETIKEIVSQYHQYTQFKRACFECEEITHNQETGRVKGMKFKLQTNADGNVVFD